jgi:hypothetical protein
MHPRVVNVRAKGAFWDLYVGRGPCPVRGEAGRTAFGNPWTVARYGDRALTLYMDHVARLLRESIGFVQAVTDLAGKRLGCWCAGRYPACHAEVLAGLADAIARGEKPLDALVAIRAEIEARLPARQGELFRG